MSTPPPNYPLNQFLNAARLRLEFWNTLYAAAMAVGAASLIAAPFVAYRMHLELRNGMLVFGLLIIASALFAVLARRRVVRLARVAEGLAVAVEDRDRISSGAEFLGDDDPIKRLAVQETEQWIGRERERLSRIKIRRRPFAAVAALLLLILLWRFTPGFHPAASHQQIALANRASRDSETKQLASANSPSGNTGATPPGSMATSLFQPDAANGQTPGASPSAGYGGGNLPSNAPGRSSIPRPTLGRALSGQSPSHRPHEESHTPLPGGAGHSPGGIPFTKVPTPILPPAPTHAVHTAAAAPVGPSKEREEIGNPTDISDPDHAAPADVHFANTVIDPTELESLPPGRRQLVIQYFRSMHEQSDAAPATQP